MPSQLISCTNFKQICHRNKLTYGATARPRFAAKFNTQAVDPCAKGNLISIIKRLDGFESINL